KVIVNNYILGLSLFLFISLTFLSFFLSPSLFFSFFLSFSFSLSQFLSESIPTQFSIDSIFLSFSSEIDPRLNFKIFLSIIIIIIICQCKRKGKRRRKRN